MTAETEGTEAIIERLAAIQSELAELREAFDSFSNGGFPLRQEVATPELLAVLAAFMALMGRDGPMNDHDLQYRVRAAMVLGTDIVKVFDSYKRSTERQNLDHLVRQGD